MKSLPWMTLLKRLQQIFWALFLLLLPVTSFPFFPKALGGEALVRPLSLFPLLALLLLVTLPRVWQRPLPRSLLPLLAFTLVAIVSSLLALLRGIEPTLGVPIVERLLRAFITLGIGAAIYLTITLYVDSPESLRRSQRWVYAGFTAALLWGAVQALYVVHFNQRYFDLVNRLQKYISTRTLFPTRVSGMTYEPNWFAEQITFLLLPWLIASVLTGYSAFNWRWRWLRLEWFLLALALAVLPFTSSRAGILVLVALLAVGLLLFRPRLPRRTSTLQPTWKVWLLRIGGVSVAAALLAGFLLVAGSKNIFFSRIWSYWSEIQDKSLASYIEYIGFGPRFIYAETGFRVYEAYPVLGVGLGNYAFYFDQMLPDRPLALQPEVLRLVTPGESGGRLITTKNLFVRLLAETGLLGTAVFLAFVIAIAGEAIFLALSAGPPSGERAREPTHDPARYWGIAGSLGLVAFLLLTFSFDSFALPNMWVVFGFITAAARVFASD